MGFNTVCSGRGPTTARLTSFRHWATHTLGLMRREELSVLSDGRNRTTRFLFDLKSNCRSNSTDGPNWKAASQITGSHVQFHNRELILITSEVESWRFNIVSNHLSIYVVSRSSSHFAFYGCRRRVLHSTHGPKLSLFSHITDNEMI